MQVKDVMTKEVQCIEPGRSVQDAAVEMKEADVGPLPVCQDGRVVGMLTDRDIVVRIVAEGENPAETKVEDVMSRDLISVREDEDLGTAAALMQQHQIRRLPVMDRDQKLSGIIGIADITTRAGDLDRSANVVADVAVPKGGPRRRPGSRITSTVDALNAQRGTRQVTERR